MEVKGQRGGRTGNQDHVEKEKRYWNKYWPDRCVGGKFDCISHNLLLELSVTLACH